MKSIIYILGICVLFLVIGCEYRPHKNYKIKTVHGETVTLSCPEIDPNQSEWSYIYSKECYVVKD